MRFGFVLIYPKTLIGPGIDDRDGREFHTADGEFSLAALRTFSFPIVEIRLKSAGRKSSTPDVTITYKKKTPTWYVV